NRKLQLPEILDRIKDIHVSCEDAIKCIQRWDSPQTLFYCDPPYLGTDLGHYKGYTLDEFKLLCETLDNIQGSYVLSNYPQEIEPQSVRQKVEIEAVMSAKGKTIMIEVKTLLNRKITSVQKFYGYATEVMLLEMI
ncbi:MAG: DNA adenine methylase, partial [Dolichospermum sp.]